MTLLFEKRDLPIVSMGFAIKNGGINEDVHEKGISHFIEHMLFKGTLARSAKEIADEIEKNGGELNGFTGEQITVYWCKIPSKQLNIALDVLADMVKNPLFDEKEMEKERKVIFEEIKMRKDTPSVYARDKISELLYEGSLGMPLIGTEQSVGSLTRKNLLGRFKKTYISSNMILCVVGDADVDFLAEFCEKNFKSKKPKIKKSKIRLKNEIKQEKRKGINQAHLIFAYHIPLANDKKNYAARVLSCLMAEGMSSRLFSEIREKRNLAYDVKGEANISKDFAHSIIQIGTQKENVEKVKELILAEFKKVSEELKEEELSQIKKQLIGNYQIGMEESISQMSNILCTEIDSSVEDFYEFEKNISNVKLKDVKELAKIKKYSFFALVPED